MRRVLRKRARARREPALPNDASKAAIQFTRMARSPQALIFDDRAGHLVGGLDDLRIHFIGALRADQVGDLRHRVDVGGFQIALLDDAERRVAGHADSGLPEAAVCWKRLLPSACKPGSLTKLAIVSWPSCCGVALAGESSR